MAQQGVAPTITGYAPALERLMNTAERARLGAGGAIVVEGEAGAGKTTLIAEFARRLPPEVRVCRARARADGDAPAFWPWAQLLDDLTSGDPGEARGVVGDDGPALRTVAPIVAARLDIDLDIGISSIPSSAVPATDSGSNRTELFDGIERIVERAAAVRAVVLVVDDLHWADVASTLLLAHLLPRAGRRPTLVVATIRSGEPMSEAMSAACAELRGDAPAVTLTGFERADIVEILEAAHIEAEPALVDTLVERTGGNPFFVTRLVAGLVGSTAGSGTRSRVLAGEVPTEVAEVVARRVARLPSPVAELLAAAATIGGEGSIEVLAAVAGVPLEATLDGLTVARGLLSERDDHFVFAHALVRDAIYGNMESSVRRRLHLRAVDALAGDNDAINARARHALSALPLGERALAVRLSAEAGAAAVDRLAFEEAADRFAAARTAGGADLDVRDRARLLVREGEARRLAGESESSRTLFREAATLLGDGDADLLADAALGYADQGADLGLAYQSNDPATRALLERAIAAQGASESATAARLRARLAAELYFSSEPTRSRPLFEEAIAIARRAGDARTLVTALAGHHDAFVVGHVPASEALAGSTEILRYARTTGDPLTLLVAHRARVFDLVAIGDFDGAAAEITAFSRIAESRRAPGYRWWPTLWRSMLALLAGRQADAEALALEAFALGERPFGGLARTNLSFAYFFLARERGTLADLEGPTRAFAADQADIPAIRAALALLLAETGQVDEARGILRALHADGFARLHDRNWPSSWFQLARAAYLSGDTEVAATLAEQGSRLRGECVMVSLATVCLGSAELAHAWLADTTGDADAADAAYRAAAATNARIGARSWLAQTRVDHAALLRDVGRVDESTTPAGLALAAARDIGLPNVERRAEALLADVDALVPLTAARNRFHRDGDVWELEFAGRSTRIPHAKGVADIAWLLARPGAPVAAAELLARQSPGAPVDDARGDPVLDERARRELREHLGHLESELEAARAAHDLERAARVAAQRDAVVDAAADAFGLRGRSRRLGDRGERARKAVTARIRHAVERIGAGHPDLGAHLRHSVDTGTFCVYRPEHPVDWET